MTFKIIEAGKRTVKTSCSGLVIETLKRATAPVSLTRLVARIRATKAGKALEVKSLKVRVKDCAEWYVNDENGFIEKNEAGEYFLAMVEEVASE